MSREASRSRRPFKVWDSSRAARKALVVSSLEELIVRGREKLGLSGHESVKSVLEADGTQVDDSEYFRSLPDNTVFLLLRPGERWCPAGVDVIRAALSSIPRIVCEAISSLDLQNEVPAWKISESRGRITIVLTWDQRPPFVSTLTHKAREPPTQPPRAVGWGPASRGMTRTYLTKDGKLETVINGRGGLSTPTITVISHDESHYDNVPHQRVPPPIPPHQRMPGPMPLPRAIPRLPNQGSSSLESTASGTIHLHTPECSQRGHLPPHPPHGPGGRGSPDSSHCDFHCCALHEEGRKIQVHKTVATSPIEQQPSHPEGVRLFPPVPPPSPVPGSVVTTGHRPLHVRFLGLNDDKNGLFVGKKVGGTGSAHLGIPLPPVSYRCSTTTVDAPSTTTESSEEETASEKDERLVSPKWLLLTDRLGADARNHLSVKDIGLILERLSAKILDVESLLRENEGRNAFNWSIKAKIRGDQLREIGVLYNGNYYAISEHPNYAPTPVPRRRPTTDDSEEDMRL